MTEPKTKAGEAIHQYWKNSDHHTRYQGGDFWDCMASTALYSDGLSAWEGQPKTKAGQALAKAHELQVNISGMVDYDLLAAVVIAATEDLK